MPIFVDSVEIEEVFVDGIEQNEVFVDGVLVFENAVQPINPEDIPQVYGNFEADVGIGLGGAGVQDWASTPGSNQSMSGLSLFNVAQGLYLLNDPEFNNQASINYDTTSKGMLGSTLPLPNPLPITFAFVYKWTTLGSSSNKLLGIGDLSGGGTDGIEFYQNAGQLICQGIALFPWDTVKHILICEVQVGQTRAWRDGVDSGILAATGKTDWKAFNIANAATLPLGMLGKYTAWSQYTAPLLTDAERNGIGLYYGAKYGIPWVT